MSKLQVTHHPSSTHRILKIYWSARADATNRQARWGGKISHWEHERIEGDVYRIPNAVPIHKIEAALGEVLRKSDSAMLIYVRGKTKRGASALRMRSYNID